MPTLIADSSISPVPIKQARILSHGKRSETLEETIQRLKENVIKKGDLPYVTVATQRELIDEMSQFAFGRWLLMQNGGLNGYWNYYVVSHPFKGRLTGLDENGMPFHPLETFLLDRAPIILATQQRFAIFNKEVQKRLRPGVSLASIPCGIMRDLLDLDFSQISEYQLAGIDLDPESLEEAKKKGY